MSGLNGFHWKKWSSLHYRPIKWDRFVPRHEIPIHNCTKLSIGIEGIYLKE